MKNKLGDLNNHLSQCWNALATKSPTAEQIEHEVKRADAIVSVSDQIIGNADLQLKAAKLFAEHGHAIMPMLPQIGKSEQ